MRGHESDARARMDQALRILRRLGNQHGVATCLTNLGTLAFDTGDFADAQHLWEEAMALWRSINAPSMVSRSDLGSRRGRDVAR